MEDCICTTGPQSGESQSPIDIDIRRNVFKCKLAPLEFSYSEKPEQMTLDSNKYTLNLETPKTTYTISGGPLDTVYNFVQLNFHWGNKNEIGSEHSINGQFFPLEMQCIHKEGGGERFAVVSYVFRVSKQSNSSLQKVLDVAEKATSNPYVAQEVKCFPLEELAKPFPSQYLTYEGSLTTTPFSEEVIWIISKRSMPISQAQIDLFRKMSSLDCSLKNNYRPPQPLNGRQIMFAEKDEESEEKQEKQGKQDEPEIQENSGDVNGDK